MARPLKNGLDYFPHDTDANNDEKILGIKSLYGIAGSGFFWELVEKIYRSDEGYIVLDAPWKKKVLADGMHISIEDFDKMLGSSLEIGLFDNQLYSAEQKLSSDGVVKRREMVLKDRNYMREWRAAKRAEQEDSSGKENLQQDDGKVTNKFTKDPYRKFYSNPEDVTPPKERREDKW